MSDRNKPAQAQGCRDCRCGCQDAVGKRLDHPHFGIGIVIAATSTIEVVRYVEMENWGRIETYPAGSAAQMPARREARSTYRGKAFA